MAEILDNTAQPDVADMPPQPAPPSAPPAKPRMSPYRAQMLRANVIMGVLIAAGGALVYGLSWHRGPAAVSAQQRTVDAQVENAILRYATDSRNPAVPASKVTDELVKSFYDQVSDKQVPLKDLKKNPFRHVGRPWPTTATGPAKGKPGEPAIDASEAAVQVAFKKLRLQSVMTGVNGSTAVISNNLLTTGQKIECFTVKSISQEAVVLSWGEREFVLKMQ